MRSQVFSLLVDNNSGVLSRISGLFSRRGYSIDSITAGMTADPRFTRITIVSSGDEQILSQIEKQLRKLEDVVDIKALKAEDCLIIELTGTQNKLEAFLNLLKDYEILELARTGITGLARGSKDVAFF